MTAAVSARWSRATGTYGIWNGWQRLVRKLYSKLSKEAAFSLDKPAVAAEVRSVGAMQVPPGNG